ncbi:polysaccharide deacetylase family protein [Sporosarcina oncorhynchi]|uniref:Polysaccharide deacetylase family protein n=1 Tax=Sporosarcina oncorhynchi TaxID=3056444 RepID=A0ABZ0L637_9BACL|nr:polysaccharide deacetylase family protein [Sporosarcina sp. T2O-4]WOV88029.1 polysaccharide deacetylase family protein [Sporosarcina sp. T2O-4]
MKKMYSILAIALGLLLFMTIGTGKAQAAVGNGERAIGLHDRILPINDIRVIDGDTKVPLTDMEKTFYLTVTTEDGKTTIDKYGKQFVFDAATGMTTLDGTVEAWKPIVEIDGNLFISVKYLTREIGFKMEYFTSIRTIRIYRDDYEHMNHDAYELMVKKAIEAAKPAPPAKPTKPSKPANPNKKAVVYLTFDDGPNQFTLKNNDTLNKYKAPATFFFIGNEMKHQPSIVKKMAKSDHSIGTHSMSHNQKLVYQSTNGFIAEMSGAADLLAKQSGKQSKLVRVPYGSVPHVTPAMQKSLKTKGYKMWDWNVDSNDWQYKDTQADQIVKNVQDGVTKQAKAGEKQIIVLMHDRSQTAIALPKIIEWLQKEGYELKKYEPSNHISKNFLKDPEL